MSVYCISDLHGRYDLFQQIKKQMKKNDLCYVLGDCGDRGPDGWKLITEIFNDPKFIYIKGNHEDMLARAMKSYRKCPEDERAGYFGYDFDYRMCHNNGGAKTFKDWGRRTRHDYRWIHALNHLPTHITYINKRGQKIELSHAGFTPGMNPDNIDYLWDRDHPCDEWPDDFNETIVVHGHTPIPYLMEDLGEWEEAKPGAFWYCNNHKVCIDCGAPFTGCTTMLNLDTLEEIIITGKDCVYAV